MSERGVNSSKDIDFDFFDDCSSPAKPNQTFTKTNDAKVAMKGDGHDGRSQRDGRKRSRASSRGDENSHISTSRSNSEESNKRSVKIAATVPRVEVESDESESDTDKSEVEDQPARRAYGRAKPQDRSRSTSRSSGSRSRSASASSTDSASTSSESDSDSDMTDVSPLQTPKDVQDRGAGKKRVGIDETVYHMGPRRSNSRPTSGKSTSSNGSAFDRLMEANRDSLNLDLLMHAIMEMEEDRDQNHKKIVRQSFVSQSFQNPTSLNRQNMSFSNDRVREIDKENERLMRNIMKQAKMAKKKNNRSAPPKESRKPVIAKIAPSALNRMREQQRIEQENFALLKRINSAKADPNLQRNRQLDSFNNSKLYGVPMKMVHPSGEGLKASSYSSLEANFQTYNRRSRPSSATNFGIRPPSAKLTGSRPASAKTTGGRPISAKSDRPTSAKFSVRPMSGKRGPRPAWDERW